MSMRCKSIFFRVAYRMFSAIIEQKESPCNLYPLR